MGFRRGDRIRVKLNGSYRYYLDGLEGTVTSVMNHALVAALDFDPATIQRLISPDGQAGNPSKMPQRVFQFHEVEAI